MNQPVQVIRWVCAFLAFWDVGLSLVALVAPGFIHTLIHPAIPPAGLYWVQRTAWVWGAFAFAEIAAARRPQSAELARLVAFLRAMDVPADLTWLLTGPPTGMLGRLILSTFPAINVAIAVVLYKAAAQIESREERAT